LNREFEPAMARFPYDVFRERLLWLIDPSKDKSAQAIIQKTKGGSWREIKKVSRPIHPQVGIIVENI
jgi:hypothetical protein